MAVHYKVSPDAKSSSISSSNALRHSNIPNLPNLERLPDFDDVSLSHQAQLFIDKVEQCTVVFDFNDSSSDQHSKDIKLLALKELQHYVRYSGHRIEQTAWKAVAKMFAANVFRPIPRNRHGCHEVIDTEDDEEPALEVAWLHIQAVYQLFLIVIESKYFSTELAKTYVDPQFVLSLLDLFGSEDPRERDVLKALIHCLCRKFGNLRALIRQSINGIFLEFIYGFETSIGIAELLEILEFIISEFAMPLDDEYKASLTRVLMPLHKAAALERYHTRLSYCIVRLLERDPSLSQMVWSIQPNTKIRG